MCDIPRRGELIARRFELRGLAESGGMSTVYRAQDRERGQPVALKLLSFGSQEEQLRFLREARLLAQLSHPAIVRYITHGMTDAEELYLVMEWLEGEDLRRRLSRSTPTFGETLSIIRQTAVALARAHDHGVVHRDIKPSNLFLVDERADRLKLVDFGLARLLSPSQAMTRTGAVVGTLGYMAPEQARGDIEIGEAADVFALGCVFFECLTGQSPFAGTDAVAVLVKILSGHKPELRQLRPDLPDKLVELVEQMMAREPAARPADGTELLARLEALDDELSRCPSQEPQPSPALSLSEQRQLSILLIAATDEELDLFAGETLSLLSRMTGSSDADVTQMANGMALVVLRGTDAAQDQACRAALCALDIRSRLARVRLALVTGPADESGKWPSEEVIERAASVTRERKSTSPQAVYVDEVTAGLLEVRFDIVTIEGSRVLVGARNALGARRLLGRRTPFVGRAKELAFVESAVVECIEEREACALLVTGAIGVGKSRLLQELAAQFQTRRDHRTINIRCDPGSAGAAFTIVAQLIEQGCALPKGASSEIRYEQLLSAMRRLFDDAEAQLIAEFLGELANAASPSPDSPEMRSARHDARVMNEQLTVSFLSWLTALLRDHSLLILLDDLHWGDTPSTQLIEKLLLQATHAPLCVLGLARPEVTKLFPDLWAKVDLQRLHLGALQKNAATQLVRAVLADTIDAKTTARLVEHADGNAFFLEELIRHVAQGQLLDFPETVLAVARSRLESLDDMTRRLLRAASIFGNVCWDGALRRLTGSATRKTELQRLINGLIEQELLEASPRCRFSDQQELSFRHELLRDAAYSTLTEEDRKLGHFLAAEWLQERTLREPLVIADHLERGGRPDLAIEWLVKATLTAANAGNLGEAATISHRGLEAGAEGELEGQLELILTYGHANRNELEPMTASARKALSLLQPGGSHWFQALAGLAGAGSWGGSAEAMIHALQAFQQFQGDLEGLGPVGYSGNLLHEALVHVGQRDHADQVYNRLLRTAARDPEADLVFLGWVEMTTANRALMGFIPLGRAYREAPRARQRFEKARDYVAETFAATMVGYLELQTGGVRSCARACADVLERASERGMASAAGFAALFLAFSKILQGQTDHARDLLQELIQLPNKLIALYARTELALSHLQEGEPVRAEVIAREALEMSALFPIARCHALGQLAAARLSQDDPQGALEHTTEALRHADRLGVDQIARTFLEQTHVEALLALDDRCRAEPFLRQALARIDAQADSLVDAELRQRFLRGLAPNQKIKKIATQLGLEAS